MALKIYFKNSPSPICVISDILSDLYYLWYMRIYCHICIISSWYMYIYCLICIISGNMYIYCLICIISGICIYIVWSVWSVLSLIYVNILSDLFYLWYMYIFCLICIISDICIYILSDLYYLWYMYIYCNQLYPEPCYFIPDCCREGSRIPTTQN